MPKRVRRLRNTTQCCCERIRRALRARNVYHRIEPFHEEADMSFLEWFAVFAGAGAGATAHEAVLGQPSGTREWLAEVAGDIATGGVGAAVASSPSSRSAASARPERNAKPVYREPTPKHGYSPIINNLMIRGFGRKITSRITPGIGNAIFLSVRLRETLDEMASMEAGRKIDTDPDLEAQLWKVLVKAAS
jgi:hypothetical protein